MKKYKFKLIRAHILTGAPEEIERIANDYSKRGWEFKSAQYFNDIICFLLVFEKNVVEGE